MKGTNIKSASISTSATMLAIAVLTVWAELSPTFKSFLAGITGHHWVTKGVFAFIFFFGLYFVLVKNDDNMDLMKELKMIIWTTVIASLIIFLFYIGHYYGLF